MSRREPKFANCEKCGRKIHLRSMSTHKSLCDKIPPPDEMVAAIERVGKARAPELFGTIYSSLFDHVKALKKDGILPPDYKMRSGAWSDCEKCGKFVGRMDVHKSVCDKLPVPAELAKEAMAWGMNHITEKYQVTNRNVYIHVEGLDDSATLIKALKNTARNTKKSKRRPNPCPRCTLDKNHPDVGEGLAGECGLCMLEDAKLTTREPTYEKGLSLAFNHWSW